LLELWVRDGDDELMTCAAVVHALIALDYDNDFLYEVALFLLILQVPWHRDCGVYGLEAAGEYFGICSYE
jgi:hypothetical protein